jgi:dephospho-CoA kinase
VLSSDRVVHRLYEDPEVRSAVATRFGDAVLDARGAVDRARLGGRVFGHPEDVAFLEALLHPRIRGAREEWVAAERSRRPPPPLLVCEVPLLYEAGLEDQFDSVVVITAPEDVRRRRVEERGQDFGARSAHQLPEHEKVARADHLYVNQGSVEDLREWVAQLVRSHAAGGARGPR